MNEAEWLTSTDPSPLITFLRTRHANRTKIGRRKLRLVGCACCHLAWPLFADEPECRALILEAERFAENDGDRRELIRLIDLLPPPQSDGLGFHLFAIHSARFVAETDVIIASLAVAGTVEQGGRHVAPRSHDSDLIQRQQADIVRDIFGNPFRPVTFSPDWQTSTAVAIAQGMYDSRDFSAMPILADALQDAGCDNADILTHCCDEKATHVRGCWIVDRVLGKS